MLENDAFLENFVNYKQQKPMNNLAALKTVLRGKGLTEKETDYITNF